MEIETNTSVYDAMDEATLMYYSYKQAPSGESNAKYLRNFKGIVAAIEHLGGAMFTDDALVDYKTELDKLATGVKDRTDEEKKLCVREKMMGIALLKRSKDSNRSLLQAIRDQHAFGMDVYPKTLHDEHELLESHSAAGGSSGGSDQSTRKDRDP